jgi:diguanylate cyclase (GGDEF)-like protein
VTVVGLLCRPEQVLDMSWLRGGLLPHWILGWTQLPQLALLLTVGALVWIVVSWWPKRRPLENAWFWALVGSMLAVRSAMVPAMATFYFATAAVVLVLAYQDELTGIPARRAFNEAVALLQEPYTIAMVDVDHFKRFNDTFGHETGDQVLRMVAGRLSRVGGNGRGYRCGGEEFALVFAGKTLEQTLPYLEALRRSIEETRFTIRGPDRSRRRRPERRYHPAERRGSPARSVSVTASFGAAESSPWLPTFEHVVNAADQALYRAKERGRNRVEVWSPRLTKKLQALSK